MGTNYYIKGYKESSDEGDNHLSPDWHIGKLSAAGQFCFDCGISLCKGQTHYDNEFYEKCPLCMKSCEVEAMSPPEAARKRTGVGYSCSFTFAMYWGALVDRLHQEFGDNYEDMKTIVSENGEQLTYQEFLKMVRMVPPALRFRHLLGKKFS
jgi:hypothetical protein